MLAAGLLAVFPPGPAEAHKTTLSTAEVVVAGREVAYRLITPPHGLAAALGIATDNVAPVPRQAFEARGAALAAYLAQRLRVWSDDAPCPPAPPDVDYSRLPDNLVLDLTFVCPDEVEWLVIAYGLFLDIDPHHRSVGVIHTPAGSEEFLFDAAFNELEIEVARPMPPEPFMERFHRVLLIGVEHIALGYDHILFLVALIMVSTRLWRLVAVVTAFTAAHSVSLALAWFGVIDLPARLVESLIALSIAYVAVENLFGRGSGHRWMIAFGFGLVHGLGFYGALKDLELAGGDAVTTLFAFNLGVEAGQLVIVAALYGVLVWAARQSWHRRAIQGGSAAIAALAAFWFVERAFFGV